MTAGAAGGGATATAESTALWRTVAGDLLVGMDWVAVGIGSGIAQVNVLVAYAPSRRRFRRRSRVLILSLSEMSLI